LGTYLIDLDRSRTLDLVGLVLLVAGFWFKQHGALFALGGLGYLTARHGPRQAIRYWAVALLLGLVPYLAGVTIFGPRFHYYTWHVPRRWTQVDFEVLRRLVGYVLTRYFVLASATIVQFGSAAMSFVRRRLPSIWQAQLLVAGLSALLGALDPGSSNNVFIPLSVWVIVLGTLGLASLGRDTTRNARSMACYVAVALAFASVAYRPAEVLVSEQDHESYADLVTLLQNLGADVYAPWQGPLDDALPLSSAAHWVALEDMVRSPKTETTNRPSTRSLVANVVCPPEGKAYILGNYPLSTLPVLDFLTDCYALETDFADRFMPLRVLPKRWDHGWPRYLYRYMGGDTAGQCW
jgi:hypothetical protein